MARRVLAVVACVSSARALVAPAVQPASAGTNADRRDLAEVETKEALPLSSVVLDEEEERRLKKERRLAAAETSWTFLWLASRTTTPKWKSAREAGHPPGRVERERASDCRRLERGHRRGRGPVHL